MRGTIWGVVYILLALVLPISFSSAATTNPTKFTHVVIVMQENRTPDNLFHDLNKYLPGADIADTGLNSKGETVTLTEAPLDLQWDLAHSHGSFEQMYDNGRMDGADRIPCYVYGGGSPKGICPAENAAFYYVRPKDVVPYRVMAVHYGWANRMFQTQQGGSFPAHQFLFSGTSQPFAHSPMFAAENVHNLLPNQSTEVGCLGPPSQRTYMIHPNGVESSQQYPCFQHKALSDLLDHPPNDPKHPISWKYYTASPFGIWTAPNAIKSICQPAGNPLRCTSPQWTTKANVVYPSSLILSDIQNKKLPAVSWVVPTGQDSDHSGLTMGTGPDWVASIVNAVGNSAYWKNTVILVTWDDWGGWYDHVAPPISKTYGYFEMGFRVPLLVVSAYTPAGYISNEKHDFGSILRLAEQMFDLGLIPPGDFADSRADDLMDFFDFQKPARKFFKIPTKTPVSTFLDKKRAMEDPDDD